MRTSNLILIGMLITTIGMMSFIHFSVYKKEKNNETENGTYYKLKEEKEKYTTTPLKPFEHLVIDNFHHVYLAYAPEYKILVYNEEKDNIKFEQTDKGLHISTTNIDTKNQYNAYLYATVLYGGKKVILYGPNFESIRLHRATVSIGDFGKNFTTHLKLMACNGNFLFSEYGEVDYNVHGEKRIEFNNVDVQLDSFSSFNTSKNYQFKHVYAESHNKSIIRLNGEAFDSLSLKLGDSSQLNINSKLLKKAKLLQ